MNEYLGKLITDAQSKDAIHIAIAPVVAAEKLSPGDHVGLASGGTASESATHIGIVDPFLKKNVKPGESFWLLLYPNTITALQHEWTHPAFTQVLEDPNAASRRWLEDIARRCGVSYERMMGAVEADDFINMGENEEYRDVLDGHEEEFQRHCGVVLGREITNAYPFSCSC